VSPRSPHLPHCWLINQYLSLFYISSRDSQGRLRSKQPHKRAVLRELIGDLITSNPACSGTQKSPTACRGEISFNAFGHCWTKRRRCSESIKSFQGCLTIRAEAHLFLWSILQLNLVHRPREHISRPEILLHICIGKI